MPRLGIRPDYRQRIERSITQSSIILTSLDLPTKGEYFGTKFDICKAGHMWWLWIDELGIRFCHRFSPELLTFTLQYYVKLVCRKTLAPVSAQ